MRYTPSKEIESELRMFIENIDLPQSAYPRIVFRIRMLMKERVQPGSMSFDDRERNAIFITKKWCVTNKHELRRIENETEKSSPQTQ
jgi:hypothetical protein